MMSQTTIVRDAGQSCSPYPNRTLDYTLAPPCAIICRPLENSHETLGTGRRIPHVGNGIRTAWLISKKREPRSGCSRPFDLVGPLDGPGLRKRHRGHLGRTVLGEDRS